MKETKEWSVPPPLVSIALATFNGEKYLRQQLDSLLNQTYKNFEIVISDDNSNDDTLNIIKEYQARDLRIKFIISHLERGFINNFQNAILHSVGEIIFLCDQDDIWYPDKLALHLNAYQDSSVQWIYNEVQLVDSKGGKIGLLTDQIPNYWSRRKLLYYTWGSCVLGCATSYRASLLKNIWPADENALGHDSWIQLAIFPAKSFFVNTILQDYRQHEANVFGVAQETQSSLDLEEIEKRVIKTNLAYLGSLAKNKKLSFWKRNFFGIVLLAKKLRMIVRNFKNKV